MHRIETHKMMPGHYRQTKNLPVSGRALKLCFFRAAGSNRSAARMIRRAGPDVRARPWTE